MRPAEIAEHVRRRPFRSIRLFLSDGSSHDVRHPELALVTQSDVAIALEPLAGELPDRMVHCDPIHVTRIEPLSQSTADA